MSAELPDETSEIERCGCTAMGWAEQLLAARSDVFDKPKLFKAVRGDSDDGFAQARKFLASLERLAFDNPRATFTFRDTEMSLESAATHLRRVIRQVEVIRV